MKVTVKCAKSPLTFKQSLKKWVWVGWRIKYELNHVNYAWPKNNLKGYKMQWFFKILFSYADGSESMDKCFPFFFSPLHRESFYFLLFIIPVDIVILSFRKVQKSQDLGVFSAFERKSFWISTFAIVQIFTASQKPSKLKTKFFPNS